MVFAGSAGLPNETEAVMVAFTNNGNSGGNSGCLAQRRMFLLMENLRLFSISNDSQTRRVCANYAVIHFRWLTDHGYFPPSPLEFNEDRGRLA